MKFSCIMTTFNDGELIRQAVSSVLNQTYSNLELLIVDDGSSAPTTDILAEFDDPRVRLLTQANDGVSSARNRGLAHACGDYFCFLDADDTRAPWGFAEVVDVIKSSGPELIVVPGIYSHGRTQLEPFFDSVVVAAMANAATAADSLALEARKAWAACFEAQPANKFIARALIERGNLRFPNDHFFEDILFHQLAVAHAQSIEFLKSPGFTYFQRQLRPQTTTSNGMIRFDILGSAQVTLQIFGEHRDFQNPLQRGAVFLSALRLLKWCEEELPAYHKYGYRQALREVLRGLNPLYLVIDEGTPDPRGDRQKLIFYAREVAS